MEDAYISRLHLQMNITASLAQLINFTLGRPNKIQEIVPWRMPAFGQHQSIKLSLKATDSPLGLRISTLFVGRMEALATDEAARTSPLQNQIHLCSSLFGLCWQRGSTMDQVSRVTVWQEVDF